jgi:hypothetical protein
MVDYNHVYKDKCLTEFLRLKECYLVSLHTSKAIATGSREADSIFRLLRGSGNCHG